METVKIGIREFRENLAGFPFDPTGRRAESSMQKANLD